MIYISIDKDHDIADTSINGTHINKRVRINENKFSKWYEHEDKWINKERSNSYYNNGSNIDTHIVFRSSGF